MVIRDHARRGPGQADAEPRRRHQARPHRPRRRRGGVRDRAAAADRLRCRARRARGADRRPAGAPRGRQHPRLRRRRRPVPHRSSTGSPGRAPSARTWPPARSSAPCPARPTSPPASSSTASGTSRPTSRPPASSSRRCSRRSPSSSCRRSPPSACSSPATRPARARSCSRSWASSCSSPGRSLLVTIVRSERLARTLGEWLDRIARRLWTLLRKKPPERIVERMLDLRVRAKAMLSKRGLLGFAAAVGAKLAWFLVLEVALWCVGIGPDVLPPSAVLASMAVVGIVALIPITPGAVGITEVAYIGVLSSVAPGIDRAAHGRHPAVPDRPVAGPDPHRLDPAHRDAAGSLGRPVRGARRTRRPRWPRRRPAG